MNIQQAKEQIQYAVQAYFETDEFGGPRIPVERQRPIFLLGAPGIGKTAIMEQIAQEMGVGLVSYSMTHHTRQSALGLPFIVKKNYMGEDYSVSEYTMSEILSSVYDCMEQSGLRQGILFLDEINCVSETLAPSMLQFLQYKTFGRHRVPEGWVVVTAGNPPEYNHSVREFDIVTWDRLKRMDVEPDYDAWRRYAVSRNVHPAILSYLEIRKADFYCVESTVDGRRFATPRGWVDLSDTIQLYEEKDFPINEILIVQYLQHERIAKSFAMFYDLFRKYRQTYRVEEILAGNANAETMAQAQRAPFDERLSLISLLLETLQGDIAKLDQREEAITQVSALLKNKKEAFANGSAQEDAEALKDISQQLQEDTRRKKKAGALAVRQERAIRTTLQLLEEMRLSISEHPDTPPASQMEEVFSSEADAVAQDAEGIRTRMEHMLDFCERAFGEGQEMLILVTELSVHALSAQFIARYGCDAYYRHNQSLLLYDRRNDLLNDIAALNLDDRAD